MERKIIIAIIIIVIIINIGAIIILERWFPTPLRVPGVSSDALSLLKGCAQATCLPAFLHNPPLHHHHHCHHLHTHQYKYHHCWKDVRRQRAFLLFYTTSALLFFIIIIVIISIIININIIIIVGRICAGIVFFMLFTSKLPNCHYHCHYNCHCQMLFNLHNGYH